MRQLSSLALCRGGLSLLASCASLVLVSGCSSETTSGVPPLLSSSPATPPAVAIAPTLAPVGPPTTLRPVPDFAPVTPPPVQPNLPDPPTLGRPGTTITGTFGINSVRPALVSIQLKELFAPGVISQVDLQFFNITRGTEITGIFLPTAIDQFKNLLIGRGNSYFDRDQGITLNYTFLADPAAYSTNVTATEEVLVILVIRDSFGQVLRLEASATAT
ncbi:MAG: hypothetical protein Q6K35_09875 [Thermostichus sp. DG02_4_bins_136]